MKALLTIETRVREPGEERLRTVRTENVVLVGENNLLVRFARGEPVPLWGITSYAATFLISNREYLHETLGPQKLDEEYGDDLMHLMWRAFEIHADLYPPKIDYQFRAILVGGDGVSFDEEVGFVQGGELRYRWVQRDEHPDIVLTLHFVPLDDDATATVNAVSQSVMLTTCRTILLAEDHIAPSDERD